MQDTQKFVGEVKSQILSQGVSIKNLENQVGQIATTLSSRPSGALPSTTETPASTSNDKGNETCKVIYGLRSGRGYERPSVGDIITQTVQEDSAEPTTEDNSATQPKQTLSPDTTKKKGPESEQKSTVDKNVVDTEAASSSPVLTRERPHPPFPQRLRKAKEEKQFDKFIEIMKQLNINIPLIEAIQQMPNYSKFMKDVLTKRRRIGEFETVALTQECSQMVQGKIPPKLKDPETFTIPCTIGDVHVGQALCDLGASINLMSLSVFKKLGIGAARPTTVTLQLADRSICYPQGKIEDVL
ncbi:hypothetical protein L195_g035493, partial [Trifolium pratense]